MEEDIRDCLRKPTVEKKRKKSCQERQQHVLEHFSVTIRPLIHFGRLPMLALFSIFPAIQADSSGMVSDLVSLVAGKLEQTGKHRQLMEHLMEQSMKKLS